MDIRGCSVRAAMMTVCVLGVGCGYFPTGNEQNPPNLIGAPDAMTSVDAKTSVDARPVIDAGPVADAKPPVSNDAATSTGGAFCETDADCAGDKCAATGQCAPASSLRTVTVTWTAWYKPASSSTCVYSGGHPLSDFEFFLAKEISGQWTYIATLPSVPCATGVTVIENVPSDVPGLEIETNYGAALIGISGTSSWFDVCDLVCL